jgi:hypothetical protein
LKSPQLLKKKIFFCTKCKIFYNQFLVFGFVFVLWFGLFCLFCFCFLFKLSLRYQNVHTHIFGLTGHFSQVVWKDSKEIGVGRSKTKDGKIVVVTNYRPAGNITGSYTTNVLPSAESTNYGKTGNISIVLV